MPQLSPVGQWAGPRWWWQMEPRGLGRGGAVWGGAQVGRQQPGAGSGVTGQAAASPTACAGLQSWVPLSWARGPSVPSRDGEEP